MSKLLRENQIVIKRIFWGLLIASPFISVYFLCAVQGGNILDIYLPNSLWNDEAFYYKQIEAMIYYGIPQGYFGYDEVPALHLTFGTWSPFSLIPYMLYGILFGWNLMSFVFANIMFMTIAFIVFVVILKPNISTSFFLILFNLFFTPGSRHIASAMVEAIALAISIVSITLLIKISNSEKTKIYDIIFFLVSAYGTLMRPYFAIYFVAYIILMMYRKKYIKCVIAGVATIVSVVMYFLVEHNLSAPYFRPSTEIDNFIFIFKYEDLSRFVAYIGELLTRNLTMVYTYSIGTFRSNSPIVPDGLTFIYIVFFVLFLVLSIKLVLALIMKEQENKKICAVAIFIMVSIFIATITLYNNGRHLMFSIYSSAIILSLVKFKSGKIFIILTSIVCIFLTANDLYYTYVPMKGDDEQNQIYQQQLEQTLEQKMPTAGLTHDRFENTIAVIYADFNQEQQITANWRDLYFFPKGYGLNYVINLPEVFKSKYIFTPLGGQVEQSILEHGKKEDLLIAEWNSNAVYLNPLFESTVIPTE